LQKQQATYSVERWESEFEKQCQIRNMVCENPYEFGDGLALQKKREKLDRVQTAHGGRNDNNNFFSQGNPHANSLPSIGGVNKGLRGSTSQGGR
jgi:hypothetical protein